MTARLPVLVSRATGPHFQAVVTDVNRRWTKGGRRSLEKLTGAQNVERNAEIAGRACLHDFKRPVKIVQGDSDVILRENTLKTRMQLLSVPDIYDAVDSLCGMSAEDFAASVETVGEG